MADAPPISSTFISMEDFEAEYPAPPPKPKPPQPSEQELNASGLPSPAPSSGAAAPTDGASTPSSFTTPAQPEPTNWVGLLMEYAAQKGATTPAFADIPQSGPLEPRFVVTVKIDEREEPFGDSYQTFARKKAAKQWACRLAMEWLAERGYISPSRVPRPSATITTVEEGGAAAAGVGEAASVASRVPELCKELGITPPTYRFSNSPLAPMVWSGYAVFPLGEGALAGKVGAFENVMGKKNAREVCAGRVIECLERWRKTMGK